MEPLRRRAEQAVCGVKHEGPWSFEPSHHCRNGTLLDHGQLRKNDSPQGTAQCRSRAPPHALWMDYFVFVFAREPDARRLSTIDYCNFRPHLRTCCELCASTKGCASCSMNHCTPQHPYIMSASNESYVDYIGRTEALNEGLAAVLRIISRRHEMRTGAPIKWHPFENDIVANVAGKHRAALTCSSAQECFAAASDGFGNATRSDDVRDAALFGRPSRCCGSRASATFVREP